MNVHEQLNLHDARVKRVKVQEINYVERSVTLELDTAGAMANAKALCLHRCRELEMDELTGCWWMGDQTTTDDKGVYLEAELITEDGETRRLCARCREITFK